MQPIQSRSRRCYTRVVLALLTVLVETPLFAQSRSGATIPIPEHVDSFGDPLPLYADGRLGTLRWRHGTEIFGMAFHPNGKTLLSTSRDHVIHIWDAVTGKELRRLEGHHGAVRAIAFDRKGLKFAALVNDTPLGQVVRDKIVIWDYKTGEVLWSRRVSGSLTSLTFSPDGTTLATGGGLDHLVYLWKVQTGEKLREIKDEKEEEGVLLPNDSYSSFSSDGRLLACGRRGTGQIWDIASGKMVWKFDRNENVCKEVAFSPDGKLFACNCEHEFTFWNISSKKKVGVIPISAGSFQFSPDGKIVALAKYGNRQQETDVIEFWDIPTNKKVRTAIWESPKGIAGEFSSSSVLAFSPRGERLAWGVMDHRIHFIDVATGDESALTRAPHGVLGCLAFSPDGRILALGSNDYKVHLYHSDTLTINTSFTAKKMYAVQRLAFSADGKLLAAGSSDHVDLWDLKRAKPIRLDKEDESRWGRVGVAFLHGGEMVISGPGTEALHLWETNTGREVYQFRTAKSIRAFALSPNESWLAAGCEDGSIVMWNLITKKEWTKYSADRGEIRDLAFSPDGSILAVAGESNIITFSEVVSGKTCLQLHCLDAIQKIAFSPDARFLASGGKATAIFLWDLTSAKRVARLRGHLGPVSSLAFSPDGRRLVTTSEDTTALLWRWRDAIKERDRSLRPLPPTDLQRLWNDLASPDANTAYRAIWTLVDAREGAVSMLRHHIVPVAAPDTSRISRLIADLNNDNYAERERAMRELAFLGELVESQLRKAILDNSSAEQRRRVKKLIYQLEHPLIDLEKLRSLRALVVLEHIHSLESIKLLERLANGAPNSIVTKTAQTKLKRSEKQKEKQEKKKEEKGTQLK